MALPFDPRSLGLGIGESASVINANEPLHSSPHFGWHHDAWLVTRVGPNNYQVHPKHHVTREADWGAWGPWDACQTDFNPR
jgi:hypothetical protein